MKGYPNFVGQSDLPKCPFENFEIEILQYGDMAFVREFLGDFVLIDAGLLAKGQLSTKVQQIHRKKTTLTEVN